MNALFSRIPLCMLSALPPRQEDSRLIDHLYQHINLPTTIYPAFELERFVARFNFDPAGHDLNREPYLEARLFNWHDFLSGIQGHLQAAERALPSSINEKRDRYIRPNYRFYEVHTAGNVELTAEGMRFSPAVSV